MIQALIRNVGTYDSDENGKVTSVENTRTKVRMQSIGDKSGKLLGEGSGKAETTIYKNRVPSDVQSWNGPTWSMQKVGEKYKDATTGWTAKGEYVYFVTTDNQVVIAQATKAGHVDIAHGADVKYAGTMNFSNGKLQSWTNDSGHYLPNAEGAVNMVDILKKSGLEDISMDKFIANQSRQLPGRQ